VIKDPGISKLVDMLPALEKIQQDGRCLLLKGQFDEDVLILLKQKIDPCGFCIQPVVESLTQAQQLLPFYREWN
jgi:hypothetical protein